MDVPSLSFTTAAATVPVVYLFFSSVYCISSFLPSSAASYGARGGAPWGTAVRVKNKGLKGVSRDEGKVLAVQG